jgi:hypothetical protein
MGRVPGNQSSGLLEIRIIHNRKNQRGQKERQRGRKRIPFQVIAGEETLTFCQK